MTTVEQFSDNMLEQDIRRLETELLRQTQMPEREQQREGREIMRSAVGVVIGNTQPQPAVPPLQEPAPSLLPSYMSGASAGVKLEVERLLDFALHKGVEAAAAEARKKSPFVLDAFHDAITDRLYPAFKARGLVR